MSPIDLRSDTVTRPSGRMRAAMAEAAVGDDWYGDDPTVNRLQERCAEITGKEAALYVATGTMANEIALHVFVRSGHFVVCEARSHVATVELHSAAVLSGIAFRSITSPRGQLTAEMVAEALVPDPFDVRIVDLVSLENTHQVGGGTVMPIDELRAIRKVSDESGVPVYLDGARIFNASVASGTPVSEYAAETDAMMLSLSKGLGAPIGSVLCGSTEFIAEARRVKILFGGAWRQAGVVAAAGLVALDEGPQRLYEDHANARRLAKGIAEATPAAVDPSSVETNIVFVETSALPAAPLEVLARLRERGILGNFVGGRIRLVTHLDVSSDDVERAVAAWREVTSDLSTTPAI
ncbi:MAG TPA: threonine aldolase family protein [Actinomycetota bacterium]|jgi:threonine aldolase